jgi:DnaJ-class molecular chaperone
MPIRNLYVVLGIPPDATPDMIRSAYRTRVKEYHPDRVGPERTPQFRELTEAYRVLSDPDSRIVYNRSLDLLATDVPVRPGRVPPEAVHVEPLMTEPIALRRSFRRSHRSAEDDFVDWTTRYFTDTRVPKSGRLRHADLEVVLSPVEAEGGGVLPLEVPVFAVCSACAGGGHDWLSACRSCDGTGVGEGRRTAWLRFPRVARDGTLWEVTLPEGGVHLRVWPRIDPYLR